MKTSPPRTLPERERWSEELLDRLTPLMSALGLVFLLVVIGERLARPGSAVATGLTVLGWALWAAFVAEFVLRAAVAPDTGRFLRRNWWQVLFLVLPFLRVFRLVRALRVLRAGRVLSSTLRSTRSAHRLLGDRIGWLAVLTVIVVLAASQVLYEFGDYARYGEALHAAALGAVSGEPLTSASAVADVMELVLSVYSVVVFASLAATLGAYFTRAPEDGTPAPRAATTRQI